MERNFVQHASGSASTSQKVLRRSVDLAFQGATKLRAYSLQVSPAVLTIMSPTQLRKGVVCEIRFDIVLGGKVKRIEAVSQTGDCVCVGTEGFRTNLRFLKVDTPSRQALNAWMNYPA